MQKITPFLWFDDKAEEAARFYTSLFPNSKILNVTQYGEAGPKPAGSPFIVTFTLDGQEYMAMNAGPEYKFTEAISLYVNCKDQAEIDHYWKALSHGGEEIQCGWLKDRYGLVWQIVPGEIGELVDPSDPERNQRVMEALFKMRKIDLKTLRKAYKGIA